MTDPITTDTLRDTLDDHVLNELADWLGRTGMPREQFYAEANARCIQAANAITTLRARAEAAEAERDAAFEVLQHWRKVTYDQIARVEAAEDRAELFETTDEQIKALVETAQWARNRLEAIADESWHGDARDFKRALIGVFADFDEALAAFGSTVPAALRGLKGVSDE